MAVELLRASRASCAQQACNPEITQPKPVMKSKVLRIQDPDGQQRQTTVRGALVCATLRAPSYSRRVHPLQSMLRLQLAKTLL